MPFEAVRDLAAKIGTTGSLAIASGSALFGLHLYLQRRELETCEPEYEPGASLAADDGLRMLHGEVCAVVDPQPWMWPSDKIPASIDDFPDGTDANHTWNTNLSGPPIIANVHHDELAGLPFGAVIHITNCFAELDLVYPWRVSDPSVSTGTGFCIGGKRIVTNHHVIKCGTSIRLQRHGVPGNYEARILAASALCDLAIVTVDDDEFWENLPAVKLQDAIPELDDTVVAVGYPMGAATVTVTRGVVSNVHLKDLALSGLNEMQLTVQIDAAINPGNSGGPVFNQVTREVVGVAFASLQEAEAHGYIIPTTVLRNFIHVFDTTGDFASLPSLGLQIQKLDNPSMRKMAFNGKPDHHDGVLVTALSPFSCAKECGVCVNDVLMAVDGNPVSEEAEVAFRGHERVHYSYLYTKKSVGDKIHLSILRRKEAKPGEEASLESVQLEVLLTPGKYLVPRELGKDYVPEYLIVGGLVLLVAGLPLAQYLEARGRFGPRHTAILAAEEDADQCTDAEAQAIIVSDCLAHELNVGYQMFMGARLTEVDNTTVRNLAHAAEMICTAVKENRSFTVLRFHKVKQMAVFDIPALLLATPTILKQHKIPSWTSLPLQLNPT